MSGLDERLARLGLRAPRYDGAHLGTLLPALADALGAPGDPAARAALGIERCERAVVVLVDGMGLGNLAERSGHAPFLRSLLAESGPGLTSSFPTTTASALGLFGTGRPGGLTGLVGYAARNPRTGGLATFVSWEGAPPAEEWQREPRLLTELAASGIEVTSVGPARFEGSGLTVAALAGGRYLAAEDPAQRVDAVVRQLRRPGLVYLYWGELDKVGHAQGWQSGAWGAALEELDAELSRLARSLSRGTSLLVTADHGMVDVDPAARLDLAAHPAARADMALLGGEPRALHVYLREGVDPVEARGRWQAELGEDVVVATREEVLDAGWFGTVAEHVEPALGDLLVVTGGRTTVVDTLGPTAGLAGMVGVHGSLTPTEVEVPLIQVRA